MIDWEQLAEELGGFDPSARGSKTRTEHGSSELARRALTEVVGAAEWAAAVDHYVAGRPGFELVRHVLWLVHPWAAMERCRDIARTAADLEARRSAVELLRVVADARALPWIDEFLHDGDPEVQAWAAGAVDQLIYSGLVEVEDCSALLSAMEQHTNPTVREIRDRVREFLDDE